MYIKQNQKFERELNKYFPVGNLLFPFQYSISYAGLLFYDGFPHIRLFGTEEQVEKFKNRIEIGMSFEMIEITIDYTSDLAYISETVDFNREVTPEIHQLIESDNIIELCHIKFLNYTTMTQENLYHLLLTWEKLIDNGTPFILIYLDDQDWYDSLSFDSKDAMEKFVADHTKSEVKIQK